MNTPIMTNFYSGEIEKTSSVLFTENYKCGIYEPNVKNAVAKIEQWVDNREELDVYAENTKVLDKHNNGAEEIADILAQRLLKED